MTESIYASAFPRPALGGPLTEPPPPEPAAPTAPPSLAVPLEVLALASACDTTSVHLRRFDLRQIHFGRDAQGCYAVATDSKIMAVARWDEADGGEPCDFGVSGQVIQAAQRAIKNRKHYVESVTARPGGITVLGKATAEYAQCFTLADIAEIGKFPEWREILTLAQKRAASGESAAGSLRVDPVLWTRVGELFQAVIGDYAETAIRIRYDDGQRPIFYESAGPSPVKLTVLLMPLAEAK